MKSAILICAAAAFTSFGAFAQETTMKACAADGTEFVSTRKGDVLETSLGQYTIASEAAVTENTRMLQLTGAESSAVLLVATGAERVDVVFLDPDLTRDPMALSSSYCQ